MIEEVDLGTHEMIRSQSTYTEVYQYMMEEVHITHWGCNLLVSNSMEAFVITTSKAFHGI